MKKSKIFQTPEQVQAFIKVSKTLTGQDLALKDLNTIDPKKVIAVLEEAFSPEGIQKIMAHPWTPLNDLYYVLKGHDHEMYKTIASFHGG